MKFNATKAAPTRNPTARYAKLRKKCGEIIRQGNAGLLLAAEDMIEILNFECLAGEYILILIQRGEGMIYPSLCVEKRPGEDAVILGTRKNVFECLGLDAPHTSEDGHPSDAETLYAAATARHLITMTRPQYRTTLFHRSDGAVPREVLNRLCIVASAIRQNSLHVLNESQEKTREEWSCLEPLLSTSLSETLLTVASFLNINYPQLRAAPVDLAVELNLPAPVALVSTSEPIVPKTLHPLLRAIRETHKPMYTRLNDDYILLVPFWSPRSIPNSNLRAAMFIKKSLPIPQYVITNVLKYIDYYFEEFILSERARLLKDIAAATAANTEAPPAISGDELNERLANFARLILSRILAVSNAHSATCRLYTMRSRSLQLLAGATDPDILETHPIERTEAIPLSDFRSVNVITFREHTRFEREGNYVPILDPTRHRTHREQSRAELCFPLMFKRECVGTLNFESPQNNGLRRDREFLSTVASAISNFMTLLYEVNDKHWLALRCQTEQNLHEIRNMVETPGFPKVHRDRVFAILRRVEISSKQRQISLTDLDQFVRRYLRQEATSSEAEKLRKGIVIDLKQPDLTIERSRMLLIRIICKNLLNNARNYFKEDCKDYDEQSKRDKTEDGKYAPDRLYIRHSGLIADPLHIFMRTQPFTALTLDRATVSPIPISGSSESVKTERVGLFLIGVLTRHLGGFVRLGNREEPANFIMELFIPLEDPQHARD